MTRDKISLASEKDLIDILYTGVENPTGDDGLQKGNEYFN